MELPKRERLFMKYDGQVWDYAALFSLVILSFFISPNMYLNPVWCVLWWAITLQMVSWILQRSKAAKQAENN